MVFLPKLISIFKSKIVMITVSQFFKCVFKTSILSMCVREQHFLTDTVSSQPTMALQKVEFVARNKGLAGTINGVCLSLARLLA